MKIFPLSQKVWATTMRWVGIVGVATAIFAAIVSQSVLTSMESGLKTSLNLANSSLDALETSTDIANSSIGSVKTGLRGLNDATSGMGDAFTEAENVLFDIGNLVEKDLTKTAKALDSTMPGLIQVAGTIDGALTALNNSPIQLPYTDRGFTKGLKELNTALEKIPGELTKQGKAIKRTSKNVAVTAENVNELSDQLKELEGTLDSSVELLNAYKGNLKETSETLEDALSNTTMTIWFLRFGALLLAVSYGLLMIIPLQFAALARQELGLDKQEKTDDGDVVAAEDLIVEQQASSLDELLIIGGAKVGAADGADAGLGYPVEDESADRADAGLGYPVEDVSADRVDAGLVYPVEDVSADRVEAGLVYPVEDASVDRAAVRFDDTVKDSVAAGFDRTVKDSVAAGFDRTVKDAVAAGFDRTVKDSVDGVDAVAAGFDRTVKDTDAVVGATDKTVRESSLDGGLDFAVEDMLVDDVAGETVVSSTGFDNAVIAALADNEPQSREELMAEQRLLLEQALAEDTGQDEPVMVFDAEALGAYMHEDADYDVGPEGNAPRRVRR